MAKTTGNVFAFIGQSAGGKFVAWGKKNAKDESFIVKEGGTVTGKVLAIKHSDRYGKILDLKTKEETEPLIITGTTILVRELGYEKIDMKLPTYENNIQVNEEAAFVIEKGDVIRITFRGMIPTKNGNEAYDIMVEKDQ